MANLSDESLQELNENLSELKVNSQTIVIKMDQIYGTMEKMEKTIESLNQAISSQEKRITILEQKMPPDLLTDFALMKNRQETNSKVLWTMVSITMGLIVQAIYRMLTS